MHAHVHKHVFSMGIFRSADHALSSDQAERHPQRRPRMASGCLRSGNMVVQRNWCPRRAAPHRHQAAAPGSPHRHRAAGQMHRPATTFHSAAFRCVLLTYKGCKINPNLNSRHQSKLNIPTFHRGLGGFLATILSITCRTQKMQYFLASCTSLMASS